MKKLTAMLFALMLTASMSMPAFAAGQQTQGDETPSQGQTTPTKHKKTKKKKEFQKTSQRHELNDHSTSSVGGQQKQM